MSNVSAFMTLPLNATSGTNIELITLIELKSRNCQLKCKKQENEELSLVMPLIITVSMIQFPLK